VSYKLAQYFVADDPPPALVDRLAKRFLDSHGDIRATLAALFASAEFWDPKHVGTKFKTPYQYVLSSLRAADVPVVNARPVLGVLYQAGMPLYGCPTPDGYKNTESAWLNPEAITRRINFATALGAGRLPLDRVPDDDAMRFGRRELERAANVALRDDSRAQARQAGADAAITRDARVTSQVDPSLAPPRGQALAVMPPLDAARLQRTLDGLLTAKTQDAVAASPLPLRAGLILGSPELMRH
jgi:uncharacterized protein (DUF1800 family)